MVEALRRHFEGRNRIEAIERLLLALAQAERSIAQNPAAGLPAPRPYPSLAQAGRRWIKAGSYWVAYSIAVPPVITAVFYDQADIPNRY